ncbi:MAG: hypothetical protein ACLVJV_08735 [Oscillospiraceae bacterium]
MGPSPCWVCCCARIRRYRCCPASPATTPLLKPRLDALRSRLLSLTLKLLWAAVSMAALYALILYVFCLPAVVEEFAATGRWLLAATIAMGVALFFVYDVLLGRLMARWPAKV